jgi:hypothetical protein
MAVPEAPAADSLYARPASSLLTTSLAIEFGERVLPTSQSCRSELVLSARRGCIPRMESSQASAPGTRPTDGCRLQTRRSGRYCAAGFIAAGLTHDGTGHAAPSYRRRSEAHPLSQALVPLQRVAARRHFICLQRTMRALLPRAYGSATAAGSCAKVTGGAGSPPLRRSWEGVSP